MQIKAPEKFGKYSFNLSFMLKTQIQDNILKDWILLPNSDSLTVNLLVQESNLNGLL